MMNPQELEEIQNELMEMEVCRYCGDTLEDYKCPIYCWREE